MRIQTPMDLLAFCVASAVIATSMPATSRTSREGHRPEPGPTGAVAPGQGEGSVPSVPNGPPVPAAGGPPGQAPRKPRTVVSIALEDPSEDKQALAKEVREVREREQPENPGRKETFGKMALRGLTPQNERTHLLRHTGWALGVRNVRRIRDGWQAEVVVTILASRRNRYPISILNHHLETYTYRNGKLAVTAQTGGPPPPGAGPNYDPSQGLVEDPLTSGLPEPEKFPTFAVQVLLNRNATREDRDLAKDVGVELERRKPENPGREKTFGKMVMVRRPPYGEPHEWKLRRLGWQVAIRRVERIPGGWRASAEVGIRAETVEGSPQLIANRHLETYTFRDGKPTLESESVDPKRDPADGLWPGFPHGWPDAEEGRPPEDARAGGSPSSRGGVR